MNEASAEAPIESERLARDARRDVDPEGNQTCALMAFPVAPRAALLPRCPRTRLTKRPLFAGSIVPPQMSAPPGKATTVV